MTKNKKRLLTVFCFVSGLFFSAFLAVHVYAHKISSAEKRLLMCDPAILNTGCTIKTFGRGDSEVSAMISFYTPSEKLIGSYERAWNGSALNLECIVCKMKNGALVFPYRLFSDTSEGTGIVLFDIYAEKRYPAIYDYSFFSQEEKKAVQTLFKAAVFSRYLLILFSSARLQTVTLHNFEPDAEYGLKALSSGGLVLQKI